MIGLHRLTRTTLIYKKLPDLMHISIDVFGFWMIVYIVYPSLENHRADNTSVSC